MKKKTAKNKNSFEIYPKSVIPRWIKKGVKCHCIGEANDVLIVDKIGKYAAFMLKAD